MTGGQNINISRIGDKDLKNIATNIDNDPSNGGKIKGSIDGGEVSLFWQQADPVIARKMKTPGFNLGYLQQFYDSHQIKSNPLDLDIAPFSDSLDIKPSREDREGEVLVAKEVIAHDAPTRAEREAQRIAEIRRAAQARQVQTLSVSGGRSLQMASDKQVEVRIDRNNRGFTTRAGGKESQPCIIGTITLPDVNGNKKTITLRISERSISSKGLSGPSQQATLNEIINQIKQAINDLEPAVKNDLFSEITDIEITTDGINKGDEGTYDSYSNVLSLSYGNITNGGTVTDENGKKSTHLSGISKKVLTHEIGHAVDAHHVESQSSEFSSEELQADFDELKSGLMQRYGKDAYTTSYVGELYFLKNVKELYAEWTAYKNGNGDHKDYAKLRELEAAANANPNDPTNKAFLRIVASFEKIEQNARASSLVDRQGFDQIVKTQLNKSEMETLNNLINIPDIDDISPDTTGVGAFESYFNYAKSDNKEADQFRQHRFADSLLTKTDDEIRSEYGSNAERYIKLRDAWRDFKELANAKFEQLGWV